jgi:hypothetical protein
VFVFLLISEGSELRAMDVRIRASRRAGELIAEGQKKGEIATQGDYGKNRSQTSLATKSMFGSEVKKPVTFAQLGMTPDQSSQWKELAEAQRPAAMDAWHAVQREAREN